jgi:hypothetical protein
MPKSIKKISVGISFPENFLKKIDMERGDITRSRYIIKFLEEKYFLTNKIETNNKTIKKVIENNNNKIDLSEGLISDKSISH